MRSLATSGTRARSFALAGLIALAFSFALASHGSEPGPRILFQQASWNFGSIPYGDTVGHEYPFKNIGTEPLIIKGVHPSCGCTASNASNSLILPGEEGVIRAVFHSLGKRGSIHKTIAVVTNDPITPTVELEFRVHVRTPDETVAARSMANAMALMQGGSIFDSACATCHVIPGRERFGRELYIVSCAMCHGNANQPAVHDAVEITGSAYLKFADETRVFTAVTKGTGNPMMPGFADAHGGPLTDSQVQSLMAYFRSIRDYVPVEHPPRDENASVHPKPEAP
jgi:mono/diheme cytochrome c family protein